MYVCMCVCLWTATCTFIGGDVGQAACQILANLCALQMFDVNRFTNNKLFLLYLSASIKICVTKPSQACTAHFAVINNRRNSRYSSTTVNNWVLSNPWLFFALPPVGGTTSSPCLSNSYKARLNLNNFIFQYSVAAYTMNGTFVGFQPLGTLFSYCGK